MDFVDVILVCVNNNKFQAFNVHMVVRDAGLLATCVRIYIISHCHIKETMYFKFGGITKCAISVHIAT